MGKMKHSKIKYTKVLGYALGAENLTNYFWSFLFFLLKLLHKNIDVVERKPSAFGGGTVMIKCKDFSVINLDIISSEDFNNVADSLDDLSNISKLSLMG